MKKPLSLLLTLLLIFTMCVGLISCANTSAPENDQGANGPNDDNQDANNPSNDNSESDNPANKPFRVDLEGYVANIGNATALGISKKAKSNASPVATRRTGFSGIRLLSTITLLDNKKTEEKNYIVMSTTDYDANAPEADQTGLTKVSFTKIVTENVTTETSGSKVIKAHKDGLSFHAIKGFTYSVYEGDTLVYSGVCDNDENDANSKIGTILLGALTDKVDYTVKYSGIGTETTITQDDIKGEIDKLYVVNGYTFISFVPEGQSQRPNASELTYDVNGVAIYDKEGYYSNDERQSFVIDNATGYVYPIKDTGIEKIENNLIIIAGRIYDIRVTENDELQFYTVVQNETLTISHYYKDIYGNKYIQNEEIDAFDEEHKTIYYTESQKVHLFSNEGVVIKVYTEIIKDEENNYVRTEQKYYKVTSDFAEGSIGEDEVYTFGDKKNGYPRSYAIIEDGYFYSVCAGYEGSAFRVNLETFETEESPSPFYYTGQNGFYFDHKTVVTYHYGKSGSGGVYNLYFADLYGENALPHDDEFGYNPNLDLGTFAEKLLDDIKIETVGDVFSCEGWKFRKTTLTETVYYQIIVGEDGKPQIVSENYIAPKESVITLQPINK